MTDREVEVAALASLGAWFRRRKPHTAPAGTACANCGAVLEGPYCHTCGQLAEDFHRSLGRLVGELFEGLLDFDGRIWRTLPRLVLKPGRLTRDYLDGHRAVQIPPLRLFLVALLLVFLLGSLGGGSPVSTSTDKSGKDDNLHVVVRDPRAHAPTDKDVNIDLGGGKGAKAGATWLKSRIIAAAHDPERFVTVMEAWGHRLAILMLPIGAGLLGLLFVFQRRFFLYDHLIFTMHSLSFQGLLLSGYFLVKLALPGVAGLLLLAAPVHLFVHMRGVYGRSVIGTLARMSVLFVGSLIGFGLLMLALVFIGLSAMKSA
jgi:hypothetical protein